MQMYKGDNGAKDPIVARMASQRERATLYFEAEQERKSLIGS